MDSEWPWAALLALVVIMFFGGLFGLGYMDYRERMECFERGGSPVKGVCVSRPSIVGE